MRHALAAGLLVAFAAAAAAQDVEVAQGTGAVLRALDKINASVTEFHLASGGSAVFGRLTVRLQECRYPADDPAGEAFAFVAIADSASGETLFSGWMLASSPALNALEHPRYDVWVRRCKTD